MAEIVPIIPLDRLMVETDAPFLRPKNIEPKPESRTNYPAYLPWVVKKLAECYGMNPQIIADSTCSQCAPVFQDLSLMRQEE
ncbi:MAG: TatD family hydrolase [Porticoccaceae bacterium]